jgi:hypothetical protein
LLFEKREKVRLEKLAEMGDEMETGAPEPPEPLTVEQEESFVHMQASIDYQSFMREPLCAAVGESYRGQRRGSMMLVAERNIPRNHAEAALPPGLSAEEEKKWNTTIGMMLPSKFEAESDLHTINKYLGTKPIKPLKKKGTTFHVAFIPTEEIETRADILDDYLKPPVFTREELAAKLEEERLKEDGLGLHRF